ncbi:MAG TPA: flagellar protein, partial [Caldithrix abyssi]|nr:flagellar protein [Caldithrix abyssi]
TLTDSQLHRLNEGVRQLNARGSQNSVILLDNTAYVVSVRNKTVVTAVNNAAENNNIFTNIDSMAIV